MNRRRLLLNLAGATLAPTAVTNAQPRSSRLKKRSERPNILFIVADDLGYADLSCFGRRDYNTPVLDRLAQLGVRFTSAYSNSPVCSATRTALITGRYQQRFPVGLEEPLTTRDVGLSEDIETLPLALRAAGYETALVGKWHLGELPKFSPLKSGYNHFWGFRGGGLDYFTHVGVRKGKRDLWDGDQPIEASGYITSLLADRTINFINRFSRNSSQPFLISLHFSAPHWPWEGPSDSLEASRLAKSSQATAMFHYDGGSLRTYAEMVKSMDAAIGRVLAAIERHDLTENTIVVFTSDNGGERFSDTWPFSGRKSELLEGGIRVPTILRWPYRIARPQTIDTPIMSMDWMPTLLGAADALSATTFDGVNILPALHGEQLPERTLFWRYNNLNQEAARKGQFKYLKIAGNSFLFDLKEDPLERANLRDRYSPFFLDLVARFNEWNKSMLPYDASSTSAGFAGNQLADRPGL